jgi:hypothetical protein
MQKTPVWLCLMLHVVWPYDRATAGPKTPQPAKAPPKRSSDLKPFPGLTRKPPCAACEQAHAHVPQPPGLSFFQEDCTEA